MFYNRVFIYLSIFSFIFILSFHWQIEAQPKESKPFSLFNVLPARALVVIGCPDVIEAKKAFIETNLYKLWQEKEVQRFANYIRDQFSPQIERGLEEFQKNFGMSLGQILNLPSGEILLALVDINPDERQMPFGIVAAMKIGSHPLEDEILSSGKTEKNVYKEINIYKRKGEPIWYTFIGGSLVMATREPLLTELIDTHMEGREVGLFINNPQILKLNEKLVQSGKGMFRLYINIEGAFTGLGEMIPPPVAKILEAVGVKDIRSIAFTLDIVDKEFLTELFFYTPGTKRGINKLYQFGKVDVASSAKNFPSDVWYFSVYHFDLKAFVEAVEEILKTVDSSGNLETFKAYKEKLELVENKLGFKLEDLAEALGPVQSSGAFYPSYGGLFSEAIGIINVNDKEKMKKCVAGIAQFLNLEIKSISHNDREMFYFSTPTGTWGENPFERQSVHDPIAIIITNLGALISGVSFFYDNNILYVTESSQCLMDYFDWKDSGQASLATVKELNEALTRISPNSFSFSYIDYRRFIAQWWNTLRVALKFYEGYIRKFGIPLDTALLPRPVTIVKHLTPTIAWTISDDDGFFLGTYSSVGAVAFPVVVGIGAGVAIPALTRNKTKAEIVIAQTDIKCLEFALKMYEMDFGQLPPTGDDSIVRYLDGDKSNGGPSVQYYEFKFDRLTPDLRYLDPWGSPYHYRENASRNLKKSSPQGWNFRSFDTWSNGPNKIDENGEGDDITNWKK